jgi:acetyl esterase/lipase
MKFFEVDLKKEFPCLKSEQNPTLVCYVNDNSEQFAKGRKNPAILIAPGGGYWIVSFFREGESIAFKYLTAGFSAFALKYSVYPEKYPTQLMEIAASMLYIRRHADEWGIDKEKIAVNGYSAGGHLAASLGVLYNEPLVLDALNATAKDIKPDAMVLGYPVISGDPSFAHLGSIHNVSGTKDIEDALYKKMWLENHINEETSPAFLWHTANDRTVSVKNSLIFAQKLAENNVPFELHVYPDGPHGLATSDYASNATIVKHYSAPWMDESLKFLFDLWQIK